MLCSRINILLRTWKSKNAYPFGGKYDFDSALCGQSTTSGPKRLKDVVISSENTCKLEQQFSEINDFSKYIFLFTFSFATVNVLRLESGKLTTKHRPHPSAVYQQLS